MLTKKSEPKDEILTEKLSAYLSVCEFLLHVFQKERKFYSASYLQYLISDPKSWNIQATALLHRSLIEVESSRTIERSINQIQVNPFHTHSSFAISLVN